MDQAHLREVADVLGGDGHEPADGLAEQDPGVDGFDCGDVACHVEHGVCETVQMSGSLLGTDRSPRR